MIRFVVKFPAYGAGGLTHKRIMNGAAPLTVHPAGAGRACGLFDSAE